MRIKLTVSYDGTDYCGWQRQKNGISVQETIEQAIIKVTGEEVKVVGSGRTDAGVHALSQVCHFDVKNSGVPAEKFYKAINTVLPQDVKAIKSEAAEDGFDARYAAKKKTYAYSFYYSEVILPLKERYATRILPIDEKKLEKAMKKFCGEHDFKAFCASGSSVKSTVRTVYDTKVIAVDGGLKVFVTGNGFLYNMVRTMVGTALGYAQEKISEEDIDNAFNYGDRKSVGKTLPAKGLTLVKVEY